MNSPLDFFKDPHVSIVYTSLAGQLMAEEIATKIVDLDLARCVNIVPNAVSIYKWEGKIEKTSECLLLIKTSADKEEELTQWIQDNHPYDIPALLKSQVATSSDFLKYIEEKE